MAGERIVGHKVGLTSVAMQQQLGVDQPDFGVLTDRMVVPPGTPLHLDALIAPRVEAEFAFRLTRPLDPSSTHAAADAIGSVALALEIIDSRIADWRIGLLDTVADNASSARIALGPWHPADADTLAGLIGTTIDLHHGTDVVATGPGAAVLGDPVEAVRWLGYTIGAFARTLDAGDIVLAGAVHASVPLTRGDWSASAAGLEPATIRIEA